MHITLHMTTGCNMACRYCYAHSEGRLDMAVETAERAIEFGGQFSPTNTGIIFFGGEPLLRREVIEASIAKCARLEKERGWLFHFKMTTNGLALTDEFVDYATKSGILIALSIDGVKESHDAQRVDRDGHDTFDRVSAKIPMILSRQPYAHAMMSVTPETVDRYAESVEYLSASGFRYIIASINYAGPWTDKTLKRLKRQYELLSEWYERMTMEEKKFYFSPFEVKLSTHIKGEDTLCDRCALGMRQVSIGPDGTIYPCVQFVKDGVSNKEYSIGDIRGGFDEGKRRMLYEKSLVPDSPCAGCALNKRCEYACSCRNFQTTGDMNKVSPMFCESERLLIPIVDRLGERLFAKRAPMFIQKHYNRVYPFLSLIEDRVACR